MVGRLHTQGGGYPPWSSGSTPTVVLRYYTHHGTPYGLYPPLYTQRGYPPLYTQRGYPPLYTQREYLPGHKPRYGPHPGINLRYGPHPGIYTPVGIPTRAYTTVRTHPGIHHR